MVHQTWAMNQQLACVTPVRSDGSRWKSCRADFCFAKSLLALMWFNVVSYYTSTIAKAALQWPMKCMGGGGRGGWGFCLRLQEVTSHHFVFWMGPPLLLRLCIIETSQLKTSVDHCHCHFIGWWPNFNAQTIWRWPDGKSGSLNLCTIEIMTLNSLHRNAVTAEISIRYNVNATAMWASWGLAANSVSRRLLFLKWLDTLS